MMTQSSVTANLVDAIDGIYRQLNEIAFSAAHQGKAIDQDVWVKLIQINHELLAVVFAQLGQRRFTLHRSDG